MPFPIVPHTLLHHNPQAFTPFGPVPIGAQGTQRSPPRTRLRAASQAFLRMRCKGS